MMHNKITREEKIRLLTGLENGTVKMNEVMIAGCEVWEITNDIYHLRHLPGDIPKQSKSLSVVEMEQRLKAKSLTVIKTHDQQTIVIF